MRTLPIPFALAALVLLAPPAAPAPPGAPPAPAATARTAPPRLAPPLAALVAAPDLPAGAEARFGLASLVAPDGRVEVAIETAGPAGPVLAAAAGLGAEIRAAHGALLFARVGPETLPALADLPGVRRVRRPFRTAPDVVSEGVIPTGASRLHSAGHLGQGTRIGVLDCGGFAGYASLLGSELPAAVTLWTGGTSGDPVGAGGHGTGCAEIVHDMAPGASLYLAYDGNEADFYGAVDWLVAQGVDVISYSCGWSIPVPYDGSGAPHNPVVAKVEEARQAGVLWVNSAGNYADGEIYQATYEAFPDTSWHSFAGNWSNRFGYLVAGQTYWLTLTWDDWPADPATAGASHDYDMDLWRWDGAAWIVVANSASVQDGTPGALPAEEIEFTPAVSDWYYLTVFQYASPRNDYLNLRGSGGASFEHSVLARTLGTPADSPAAVTVGALHWSDFALEPFSSRGPTLGPGGTPAGGHLKPDLVAPDAVSTVTYGASNGQPWPGGSGFFGTSASCPHVAGGAALLLDQFPHLTAGELADLLRDRAIDAGVPGPDPETGHGFLRLDFDLVWADGFEAGSVATWSAHLP